MKQTFALLTLVVCMIVIHNRAAAQGPAEPAVRNEEMRKVLVAKDGEEKERAYLELMAKFPPEQFGSEREQSFAGRPEREGRRR